MHIKSFYTQQHCFVSLKTLYPYTGDSNPGLLLPEADAMSTAVADSHISKSRKSKKVKVSIEIKELEGECIYACRMIKLAQKSWV
jgi:hypothetical protein